MKRSGHRRGVQDLDPGPVVQVPEKSGWVRKFCGRGIFWEVWRRRYLVLRGDQLFISDREVRDERKAQDVLDLVDYEGSEELKKMKSRSKKSQSRFTLLTPGGSVPSLVFLAVSPEEKESWVHILNVAIVRAKNRVLDQVSIEEDAALLHLTRDRARIPQGRRLPTRGHLLASTSPHGVLTLDLVSEEVGGRQRAGTDVSKLRATSKEPQVKTGSLPRGSERSWGKQPQHQAPHAQVQVQPGGTRTRGQVGQCRTPQPGKRSSVQGRSRCASMDEVLSSRPVRIRSELRSALGRCPVAAVGGAWVQPVGQMQSLIAQRMQRAQELLEEMRLQELQKAKEERQRGGGVESPRLHQLRGSDSAHSRVSGSPRSRSSDVPRPRDKDSPRPRARASPRSKAKKNRTRGTDSPGSRASHSPGTTAGDSPQPKSSPRPRGLSCTSSCTSSSSSVPQDDSPAPQSPPDSSQLKGPDSPRGSETQSPSGNPEEEEEEEEEEEVQRRRTEAERLLEEAVSSWKEAQEVLQEVKELQSQTLRRQRRRTYEKEEKKEKEKEEEEKEEEEEEEKEEEEEEKEEEEEEREEEEEEEEGRKEEEEEEEEEASSHEDELETN
ncbi:pleckstrin homology domain-containing family O member 1-A isoform X2 [Mugil cephalus]|uniref:pleckstrin homology domain-containing family O member 1-A isoform X2 n=1 Tax=Mugil cephalus TaxID=48193 RepID=UPI001FB731EA|nr:pleckstrin homology domain-containing family O member 1-A isoform X2 [Mugil cephalus]